MGLMTPNWKCLSCGNELITTLIPNLCPKCKGKYLIRIEQVAQTPPMPEITIRKALTCPDCDEPFREIWGLNKYTLRWDGKQWSKDEEPTRLCCAQCGSELDTSEDDIQDIMKQVGLL